MRSICNGITRLRGLRELFLACGILSVFLSTQVYAGSMMPDKPLILDLLEQEKFSELDSMLGSFQKSYEEGKLDDRVVAEAFWSFSSSDPLLEDKLSKWIEVRPDSWPARLARGIYYVNIGFKSRGFKFRNKTSDEQIDKMRFHFELAAADLVKSLSLNPRLTVSYRHLMRISMNIGGKESTAELFNKAMAVDPASYKVWLGYLFTLQPKWGGSMQEMGAAIRKMEQQYSKNPELKALAGYMPYTYGNTAELDNKRDLALDYYNKAVDFGDHPYFLVERGELHYRMKNYDAAFQDFNRVLEKSPFYVDALRWRGKVHVVRKAYDKAMDDYILAIRLDKLNPDFLRDRGELLETLDKIDLALKDYSDALVYGHNKVSNWYNRGALYLYKIKDYKKAADDLEKAVEMEPEDPYYWYRYGLAHYHSKDCKIMKSLGTYVELCGKKKCQADQLDWAKKSLLHLKEKGTCR